jgi:hypothetical protein
MGDVFVSDNTTYLFLFILFYFINFFLRFYNTSASGDGGTLHWHSGFFYLLYMCLLKN